MKSYLVIEEGIIKERVIPVEVEVTMGRGTNNDIRLADPTVSRYHARVSVADGQAFVEDLGSSNGTYVNDERVSKSALANGDGLRIGSVSFMFVQEEDSAASGEGSQTQMLTQEAVSPVSEGSDLTGRSRRLLEAISRVALFTSLGEEHLARISRASHLLVFDQGRSIFRQGDRGRSLYIILDGQVKVYTYDNQGREIVLAFLGENQFFGEISFLRGVPRTASVQAVEESLICELGYREMQEVVRTMPRIKGILEEYYRERLADLQAKKRAAGVRERRKHPRFNVKMPVNFSVSAAGQVSEEFRGKVFRAQSSNISLSGLRIESLDRSLVSLAAHSLLRIEICLPLPWGSIRCLGTVRNLAEGREAKDVIYLGVEFTELTSSERKRLKRFLTEQ